MLILENEEVQNQFSGYYFDIGMKGKESKESRAISQSYTSDTYIMH